MRATETVLFDLDGTLHSDTIALRSMVVRIAGYAADRFAVDVSDIADAYLRQVARCYDELSDELEAYRSRHVQARCWGRALAEFGIRDREFAGFCSFALDDLRAKHTISIPGIFGMLEQLRSNGVKLGLVSSDTAQTHRRKSGELALNDVFDAVFLAEEIGAIDSDPEVFRYACKRLKTSADASVMVGDVYDRDIAGARAAGLFTVWVDRGQNPLPESLPKPDATVRSIAETPTVLPPLLQS